MFRLFRKGNPASALINRQNTTNLSSIRDLTTEQNIEIEQYLSEGMKPQDIEEIMGIPKTIIYSYQKYRLKGQMPEDNEIQKVKRQIELLKQQSVLDDLQDELSANKDLREIKKQERELELEMKKLDILKAKAELSNGDYDDEEDNMESVIMNVISMFMGNMNQGQNAGKTISPAPASPSISTPKQTTLKDNHTLEQTADSHAMPSQELPEMTDEEILEFLATVPKMHIKAARKMSDSAIKKIVQSNYDINEKSLDRAIQFVKEGKV